MNNSILSLFNPRLYVGTYAKYNNGSIDGKWLDLNDYSNAEEFYDACSELHSDEDDPEFMFQDFEGFPSDMYSESGDVSDIYKLIDFVECSCLDYDAILAGLDIRWHGTPGNHSAFSAHC